MLFVDFLSGPAAKLKMRIRSNCKQYDYCAELVDNVFAYTIENPDHEIMYQILLGLVLESNGNLKEARSIFKACQTENKQDNLAQDFAQDRVETINQCLRLQQSRLSPRFKMLPNISQQHTLHLNELDKLIEIKKEHLRCFPDRIHLRLLRALAYEKKGAYSKAWQIYNVIYHPLAERRKQVIKENLPQALNQVVRPLVFSSMQSISPSSQQDDTLPYAKFRVHGRSILN